MEMQLDTGTDAVEPDGLAAAKDSDAAAEVPGAGGRMSPTDRATMVLTDRARDRGQVSRWGMVGDSYGTLDWGALMLSRRTVTRR